MNTWQPLWQLFLARIREFFREPEAVFWVYGFPLLLAIGLGIAFASGKPAPPLVDVQRVLGLETQAQQLIDRLAKEGFPVEFHDEADCSQRYRTGKTALWIIPTVRGYEYVYDPTREESLQARYRVDALVQQFKSGIQVEHAKTNDLTSTKHWTAGESHWETVDRLTTEPGNRYIDFLIPGLMGMSIMGGGLWGVGFVIVDMRVRKLLKRLMATPMRRSHFLLSILLARMVFLFPEMLSLVLLGRLGFGIPMLGSYLTLLLVVVCGAAAFAGIGLFVACRASKIETISGLMNLVMLPMWLLSGTFFSSRRFPDVAQPFIQALPLTQVNDALREVMLEGATLTQISWRLAILALYTMVCFALALKWFRWQ